MPPTDIDAARELAQSAGIPVVLAQLLRLRGVHSPEAAERFLNVSFDHLHDPYSMAGMTVAVARVKAAIARREPILIYGDYDVDGTVAVVLLKTAIEMIAGPGRSDVRFHVPHRLREGYGMKSEVVEAAVAAGARLVISVDTGIRAFAAAEAAASLGIDLIVTDHHLPDLGRGLPPAIAVLNPNQQDCQYACKHLCGAGVAFKLAQALLEAHDRVRAREKILPSFLKMLAIATIADAVPLLGENRAIAALGIEQLGRPAHPGLRALLELAKLDPVQRRLTSTDIAFRLAPRINAAGRMDIASEVVEMFTTRDSQRARFLAEKLDRLNSDRRNTEAGILDKIEAQLKQDPRLREGPCIVLDGEGWHRGVIGILASRVVEQTGRPAIVITHEADVGAAGGDNAGEAEAHGSGRSIPGFHLLQAIESCHELFTRFGGHAHAVGFSLPSSRVPELRQRLTDYAGIHLRQEDLEPMLLCDAYLPLDQITPELYACLQRLHPTGMNNEDPRFVATNVKVVGQPRILKELHVKLQLARGPGEGAIPALAWRWAGRLAAMGVGDGALLDVVYRLRHNQHPDFGGVELEIEDLRLAEAAAVQSSHPPHSSA
ncbi:Single-stranded-DNA-specific exonuclease RecJ [Acidisarcina polymorpha]|uniref:Single-stranded-DNA-specific exonuclease RecJ n=1 Tax=Acidisarcina polymorpha TaxID=2211140 RepID=A0A2Z5G9S3_9BACT|nr:Single-stranded-DNA-specific exonuclease RecJ [Acidisarcina polymorpha]